jgi:hypothetical protein
VGYISLKGASKRLFERFRSACQIVMEMETPHTHSGRHLPNAERLAVKFVETSVGESDLSYSAMNEISTAQKQRGAVP